MIMADSDKKLGKLAKIIPIKMARLKLAILSELTIYSAYIIR
jgi:hypothetical protein